jgi:hypothetical protein
MYIIRHSRMRAIESGLKALTQKQLAQHKIVMPEETKLSDKMGALLSGICDNHGVRPENVLGRCRTVDAVKARQEFFCVLYFKYHYTPGDIGRLMNMDLTSVKHLLGLRKSSPYSHEILRKQFV